MPIRVLLVEDNAALAGLAKEVLTPPEGRGPEDLAFEVAHVERLAATLACLDQGNVDVVLLDLTLPDSAGLATFQRVHAHAPSVPIVVLTALDDEAMAVQAVREGAQDYLVKGQLPLELVARALRYAVERQRAEAGLRREQTARAAAEEALERARREMRALEQLAAPRATRVTAQVFGVESLSRAAPPTFRAFVERYAGLLDLAIEQRTYRVDHRLSDALRALADELGFLNAGPRDVVEVHTAALKERIGSAPPLRAQAYVEEARVLVLELMGYLVAYYRA